MVEAYFDESGTHYGSPLLCVSGFIIEDVTAKILDSAWREMLKQYGLPYFHMVDCAQGVGVFKGLSMPSRIEVESVAIGLLRGSMAYGISVSVRQAEFDLLVPKSEVVGGSYSLLAHMCLVSVKAWCEEQNFLGQVAYFFEAGHRSQAEANAIMAGYFCYSSAASFASLWQSYLCAKSRCPTPASC